MCIKVKLIPRPTPTDSQGCCWCCCHCHGWWCTGFAAQKAASWMTDSFHMWNQLERWIDWLSTSETLDRFTPSAGWGSWGLAGNSSCYLHMSGVKCCHAHSATLSLSVCVGVFVFDVYSRNCNEIVSPTWLSMPEVRFFFTLRCTAESGFW